jgi:hypothetical protein
MPSLPETWTLAASAFNWTPDVIRAERTAAEIAVGIVRDGVAHTIEIEPGQLFRGFPEPAHAEVDAVREHLSLAGGRVSIVGASLDDILPDGSRRTPAERLAFLAPQIRAARRLGATGIRVPFGQAGGDLLRAALPLLHESGITLFEEIQGQQTLAVPAVAANLELLSDLDDPRVRVLIDISMLMPSLPSSYLDRLRAGGVPEELVRRLATEWRSPETHDAVVDLLRSGGVPPAVHTLFMNLLVRFGRCDVADLRQLLPLTAAFHLKFWDLDDEGDRVSAPIRELGTELRRTGFAGTLCSEWGGHEWIDDEDPTDITRRHLALARAALAA